MTKRIKTRISQQRTVHMYAELWHASSCVLERGLEVEKGCSWQFLSSIVLTAFTFEAYLNHVGAGLLSSWESVETLSPMAKFHLICEILKVKFPKGAGERPLQTLEKLKWFRNTMAHGKTKTLKPDPVVCDAEHADKRLRRRPLDEWERLIQTKDFAELARVDLEEVLGKIDAARPMPKEGLFVCGIGVGKAVVVHDEGLS